MTVIFELMLGRDTYQVLRTRKVRRGPSTTVLELRVQRDGEWAPLTGNSVEETEATIVKLLGMAYRTFVNSAFLLQGRADEFTKKQPAERKQILADVLNLQRYEQLEREARDRRRELEIRKEELGRHLQTLDGRLQHEGDFRDEASRAEQTLLEASEALDAALAEERSLRAKREALRADEQRYAEARAEYARIQHEVAVVDAELRELDLRRSTAQRTL